MKSYLKKAALASLVVLPAAAHAAEGDQSITEQITEAVTTGSTVATSIVVALAGLFVYKVVSRFIKRGLGSM